MTVLQQSLFDAAPVLPPVVVAKPLRPYQLEAVEAVEAHWAGGGRRALVALPTGTGKTRVFSEVIDRNAGALRVLVIAHREELLDQAAAAIAENTRLTVGVEQADRRAGDVQVMVASIQTMASRRGARRPARSEVGMVVIDEAHHASARTYVDLLHHYGLAADPDVFLLPEETSERSAAGRLRRQAIDKFEPAPDAPLLLGVTATPSRSDSVGLEAAFDEIVYRATIRDMILAGWLSDVRGVRVQTGTSLEGVKISHGDFNEGQLQEAVNNEERNRLIVAAYRDHAPGRQFIAFTAGVKHAEALAATFREAGIPCDWVSGAHETWERRGVIESFKRGELTGLCNVAVLTEGFDHPATSCILMCRPTKSSVVYTQALGRGTRLAPGKSDIIVIDFEDVVRTAGIATANALFGLPPRFNGGAEGLAIQGRRFEEKAQQYVLPEDMLGDITDWDDIARVAASVDPLRVAADDAELQRAGARLAWIKTTWGYNLSLGVGEMGAVVDTLGHTTLRWRLKGPGNPPVTLGRFDTPAEGVAWAEGWVNREQRESVRLAARDASWRRDEPTEKQLEFARKLKVVIPPGARRGQVSALIEAAKQRRRKGGLA